jgi:hypothetical protein
LRLGKKETFVKPPGILAGIRGKLIAIFVLIKVLPLVLLAWFAWNAARSLGEDVSNQAGAMADATLETLGSVGKTVTDDSIRALDLRSREAIEEMTTDTAKEIASFLYDRDRDILALSDQEPSEAAFARFLDRRTRPVYRHGTWKLSEDGKTWVASEPERREAKVTRPVLPDNAKDFHARPAEYLGEKEDRPLFVEATFVGLDGQERIKVTRGDLTDPRPRKVSDRSQTFVRAETYFAELAALKRPTVSGERAS